MLEALAEAGVGAEEMRELAGEAQREEGVHLDGHRKPVDVTVEAVV